ncbi:MULTISPECIES: TrpB-like pyridoxal phosphate-dependent enzyme [unclassified Clostridium]|uniref:TrpB-like pyridoxal phosphate-dependent enzyme n=1 Tax=unclassified Clostridium TaxID=2614128 RepID=UPI0011062DAE|nr:MULTISPECIES: TrpB-like pyridoxal phosphate-dependent enzyme [unclassified Clostridium]
MSKKKVPGRIYLTEDQLPKAWYNMQADMPNPVAPPLNPSTHKPASGADFEAIFPKDLIEQEMTLERYIDIPDEVMKMYKLMRPSPLIRAYCLEEALGTPAHIYYKYEGNNASGSHKLNSAVPQAYYNKIAGIKKLTTETGAGQWGTALSIACGFYDMACEVYMVRVSYDQKPYRRVIMETYGGSVIPSPSHSTESGRRILREHPDSRGSLAIAIAEAVEVAAGRSDTNYALGSVLNHVLLHQTIIGLEAQKQFEIADEYPDIVIGCCGGGSNLGGIAFPFMRDKIVNHQDIRIIGVEPAACPSLTKGKLAYDFGDASGFTPLMKMYTLGHDFVPSGIHAGGLRYHGCSPIISKLHEDGLMEATAVSQSEVFAAAKLFAKHEALLPAPESSHAIAVAIQEALKCKETGEEKVILFNLSGNGYLDLAAYDNYNHGKIVDAEYTDEMLAEGLKTVPEL